MGKANLVHEIVQNYRDVGADLGRSPSLEAYTRHKDAKFTAAEVLEVFKSGHALMRAAGLITPRPKLFQDPKTEPVIGVIDLEVLPMEVYTYGLFDQNMGVNQIIEHASLASFAIQKLGQEIEYYEVNWRRNPRDDKALTKKLHEKMSSCDIIIGQNIDAFDTRVANERFLEHDLGPAKPVHSLDTLKMSRRHFKLPSHSLEYKSKRFCENKKLTNRKFHGILLQIECLKKNPEAWAEMQEYNKIDVLATAEFAKKIAPWYEKNLNSMKPGTLFQCSNILCGSTNIIHRGWKPLRSGTYKQYTCLDCGKWFHEGGAKNNALSPNKKASLKGPI